MDKIIKKFNLDLSDIQEAGENRAFSIIADSGAEFILKIKDTTTGYYYNFYTNTFQATQTSLDDVVVGGIYNGNIQFPSVTGSDDQYDIYLHARPGTKHTTYKEVRFADGSMDLNSSVGSNSLMMQKVIYQYTDVELTIGKHSLNGTIESTGTGHVNETITIPRGRGLTKASFTVKSVVTTASKAYKILKQPSAGDIISYNTFTVGSSPELLPGESEHPTLDITAKTHGSTATSSSVTVTMADTIGDIGLVIGDRVRLTSSDGLDFSSIITVSAISGGGLASNQFTASSAISVSADTNLYFYHKRYKQWPINNIENIQKGMIVKGTNVTSGATVSDYEDSVTMFEGTENEQIIVKNKALFKDTKGQKPTINKGLVTAQLGNIVFSSPQLAELADDSITIYANGEGQVNNFYNYDVKFTDLAIELTTVTTTTTAAVNSSTTVPVTEVKGILTNNSTVSGIGIDASSAAPTVTARSATSGNGNLTLSAAQTIESGATLNFEGAGQIATITGNIEILKAGTANQSIYFDLEKLLSIT